MTCYTKLFNSILYSTIWRESDATRIVWITMLAMADKNGEVMASIPGLADAARVSIDDCVKALEVLKSPDKWSRTQEFEGRRIKEIQGGWLILNHNTYRQKLSEDDRKEYKRRKQAEYRERQKAANSTMSTNGQCGHNAEAEAKADTKALNPPPTPQGEMREGVEELQIPKELDCDAVRKSLDAWLSVIRKEKGRINTPQIQVVLMRLSTDCKGDKFRACGWLLGWADQGRYSPNWNLNPEDYRPRAKASANGKTGS